MNTEWLRHYVDELEYHLINFREIRDMSKQNHQKRVSLVVDPERRALLIKEHLARNERQEKSIAIMEKLQKEALNRLLNPE